MTIKSLDQLVTESIVNVTIRAAYSVPHALAVSDAISKIKAIKESFGNKPTLSEGEALSAQEKLNEIVFSFITLQ